MDSIAIISFLQESLFVIAVFGTVFIYTLVRGKQAIINLILGLYFALLITLKFPYFDFILAPVEGANAESIIRITIFGVFTLISTILFSRLMPRRFDEKTFQGLGKKILFSLGAGVLIMAFSYHTLPVLEFVNPGTPMQSLFGPEQSFFIWLIIPIAILFLL